MDPKNQQHLNDHVELLTTTSRVENPGLDYQPPRPPRRSPLRHFHNE